MTSPPLPGPAGGSCCSRRSPRTSWSPPASSTVSASSVKSASAQTCDGHSQMVPIPQGYPLLLKHPLRASPVGGGKGCHMSQMGVCVDGWGHFEKPRKVTIICATGALRKIKGVGSLFSKWLFPDIVWWWRCAWIGIRDPKVKTDPGAFTSGGIFSQ